MSIKVVTHIDLYSDNPDDIFNYDDDEIEEINFVNKFDDIRIESPTLLEHNGTQWIVHIDSVEFTFVNSPLCVIKCTGNKKVETRG